MPEAGRYQVWVGGSASGKVSVENINSSRQVSEPGAKLQFTNTRTNAKAVLATLQSQFPGSTYTTQAQDYALMGGC